MVVENSTIMIVDDTVQNLRILENILWENNYRVLAIPDGEKAISIAEKHKPDLILLDINMPKMNGFEVCKALKSNRELSKIPIIFISALMDVNDKVNAFKAGGVDYITKPFQYEEVLARVYNHLTINIIQKRLEDYNNNLNQIVNEQVDKITDAQFATIFALAKLAESRDYNTGKHLERVQEYCDILCEKLKHNSKYEKEFSDEFILNVKYASALHDVGKVAILDAILLKPAKLSIEEYEIIKTHSEIGANMLSTVLDKYPDNYFIKVGIDVARHHHERWDGKGYPDRLKAEDIPLTARLISVVDVYDAVRSKRSYKDAISHNEAVDMIINDRGVRFDPEIVDAFIEVSWKFDRIFKQNQ